MVCTQFFDEFASNPDDDSEDREERASPGSDNVGANAHFNSGSGLRNF